MPDKVNSSEILIYGAYGYSGALIAQAALERGLKPVLAGRDAAKLAQLSSTLGLESRVFALDDLPATEQALQGISTILHCAGPFIHTWKPIAEACLRRGIHYLDITGEVAVFEGLARLDNEAKHSGVILLPGVGFDVVPSDCLAVHLKSRLPSATRLTLAFRSIGRSSQGTARTALENLGQPSMIRRGGKLISAPLGSKVRQVDFGRGPAPVISISWGDLSTAYYSTQIPNIETYIAVPKTLRRLLPAGRLLSRWLTAAPTKALLQRVIRQQSEGPTAEERARGLALLWGEVVDNTGKRALARLTTPEAYTLTAQTAVAAAEKILSGKINPGFQTPASAFGKNFILEIPGCAREDILAPG
jgi:short subunit dehydrogenase-like uncharacterized protein